MHDKVDPIPGTHLFDGAVARRGYALNAMCFSFNLASNRLQFLSNEEAYCARYGLTAEQRDAIALQTGKTVAEFKQFLLDQAPQTQKSEA